MLSMTSSHASSKSRSGQRHRATSVSWMALGVLLFSLLTFVSFQTPRKVFAASPACALSASAPSTIFHTFGWPDTKIGVLRNGTSYNFFASTGGTTSGQIGVEGLNGTLDNPQAYSVYSNSLIHNLQHTYNYAAGGKVYQDQASGLLILLYHAETWPQAPSLTPFYSRLGLAKSTDGGQNWYDLGKS